MTKLNNKKHKINIQIVKWKWNSLLTKQDEDEVIVEKIQDEKSSPLWFLFPFRQKAEVKNSSNFTSIQQLHRI